MFSKTLKDTEAILEKYGFLRTHQSFLINPNHLKKYIRHDGGSVIMSNDIQIPISISKRKAIMEYLETLRG